MKFSRLLIAAAAALLLVCPTYTVNADAVVFSDVSPDDWFYFDVAALSGLGVIVGYPDGTFRPDGNVTYAEFTKLLVTALGLDVKDTVSDGIHWAQPYIDAARKAGIIPVSDIASGEFSPDKPITRSYMTFMTATSLDIEDAYIDNPFTDTSDRYAINAYNAYLLRGFPSEKGREYRGSSLTSRAETASIVSRVIDYSEDPAAYRTDAILDNAENNSLSSEKELIDLFCTLNASFADSFTFTSPLGIDELTEYYKLAEALHPELFYCSYSFVFAEASEKYTIELEYGTSKLYLKDMHTTAVKAAESIAASYLDDDMTDLEKAQVLHDYLVLNCRYDAERLAEGTLSDESYRAFGALIKKTAVCQGYSAAYNLLCKAAGLRSIAVPGTASGSSIRHMWNIVLIGGVPRYVDVTMDDPVPDKTGSVSYTYFDLSAEMLSALGHEWDNSFANIKYFY